MGAVSVAVSELKLQLIKSSSISAIELDLYNCTIQAIYFLCVLKS